MKKKPVSSQKNIIFVLLPLMIIFFDQLYKYKVRHAGGFFICNRGISFGIWVPHLEIWLTLATFLLIRLTIKKHRRLSYVNNFQFWGIILLLSGAFSNISDRLTVGCVVDYFSFPSLHLPYFNLADIVIFLAGILLFIHFSNLKPGNSVQCVDKHPKN